MEIFKIGNNYLDEFQKEVVLDDSESLLVVAGAGSGKTFTILGKVKYLIEIKGTREDEILLLSLTNDTVNNLKEKLNNLGYSGLQVLTFHKLGLNILNSKKDDVGIVKEDYLSFIIDEYFMSFIFNDRKFRRKVTRFFRINIFKNLYVSKEYLGFKQSIIQAIRLIKNRNYKIEEIFAIYERCIFNKFLWKIILDILTIYERELDGLNLIDFDDMINKATEVAKGCDFKYKYIIIDEFQDISMARYYLIKEILKISKANIIAVGDDWQSIYGFTGCEVEILVNFKKYFANANVLFLKNTYRNSKDLISVASSFILKNKNQITKDLLSFKDCNKPLKIIFNDSDDILIRLEIYLKCDDILILGRNNYDIKKYRVSDKMRYLTVHKSKGLEAEQVVLINLENKIDGFPNKKKYDKIIEKIKTSGDTYPFAEERRLFYVALTRTKNNVYMVVSKENKSLFIKEILKDYKDYIEFLNI